MAMFHEFGGEKKEKTNKRPPTQTQTLYETGNGIKMQMYQELPLHLRPPLFANRTASD